MHHDCKSRAKALLLDGQAVASRALLYDSDDSDRGRLSGGSPLAAFHAPVLLRAQVGALKGSGAATSVTQQRPPARGHKKLNN